MGRMQGPVAYRGRVFLAGLSTPCLLMEGSTGKTIRSIGDKTERLIFVFSWHHSRHVAPSHWRDLLYLSPSAH